MNSESSALTHNAPRWRRCCPAALLTVLLALSPLAYAHEGEVHADDPPARPAAAPGGPRFVAVSELFELVGSLDGPRLRVFVDRFADNTPVKADSVEIEIGQMKLDLHQLADGEFDAALPQALAPGLYPVSATVIAGDEADLLATSLDIPAPENAAGGDAGGRFGALFTVPRLIALAAVLGLLAGGGLLLRRRQLAERI